MNQLNSNLKTFLALSIIQLFGIHASICAQGQMGHENTVAVVPFSTAFEQDEDEADYSRMLTETILSSIVQTQRFKMVDITDMEKVLMVIRRQQIKEISGGWKDVTEAQLVEAGKQLGIEYIFAGTITNVSTSPSVSGLWRAEFGFAVKAISVESGRIYVTETFSVNSDKGIGGRLAGKDSKKEALNAALENANEPVKKFIDKYFPTEVKIFKEKDFDKKGIPKFLVINGGLSNGLRVDQEMDVVIKETDEYGAIYWNKIGEIKIGEIEASFSTCKIRKGGEDIHKAMAEQKDKLLARSKAYD